MKKNVKAITCATLSMLLANSGMVLYAENDETIKDETVYAMLNSDSSVDQEIVSSWLHSDNGIRNVKEQLGPSNVKNMKSDEKLEVSGKTYTWNADSNDIYYGGTSTKTLPVQVRVTHKLDSKEINGKDLIGKGGKLEIRISLRNTRSKTVNVDGRQTRIHPFYTGAGVLGPSTDHFSNVKCGNGKVFSEGNNIMVAFISVPRLQDTLKSCGVTGAKELPMRDDITITCEAKDFEFGPVMFAVTPKVSMDKLKDINSTDDPAKGLDELTNVSAQLLNGTSQLSEGAATFQGKMQELVNGVPTLTSSVSTLRNGTQELVSGSTKLYSGLQNLHTGIDQAKKGITKLSKATDGLGTLAGDVDEINTSIQALAKGLQDGNSEPNASLSDEMPKNLADGLGNVSTLQEMFKKDQRHVAQVAADLGAALTSTDVDNAAGKLRETTEYLKEKAFNNKGEIVGAETTQAPKSLKSANDCLLDYKTQTTASAVNLQKQPTRLQADSANLKNLSDMADSAAEILPKLGSFKASLNTALQGAQQLARGMQQFSEKSSSLLELKKGVSALGSSMTTAVGGNSKLYKGSQALISGLRHVDQEAGALQNGSAITGDGTQQLYDASTLLKGKIGGLYVGVSKFKATNIDEMQKQVSLSLDDVTQLPAIKNEIVREAGREHTFNGTPKNSESKVKYIYKIEELQREKKTGTQETKRTKEETKGDFFDKVSSSFSKTF